MKTLRQTREHWQKPVSRLMVVCLLNLYIPHQAIATVVKATEKAFTGTKLPLSKKLSLSDMSQEFGRGGRLLQGNPYYAGTSKTDVVYKGINLRTGNLTLSATDMAFEGGYGVPGNVTRSYSANTVDEGPLGTGWTLSVDLRTTGGGLLKRGDSPVRSTPISIRNRPSAAVKDPNTTPGHGTELTVKPVEGVTVVDASGDEYVIQRDMDGILTPPVWDQNKHYPKYRYEGETPVMSSDTVVTPEGTVYQYEEKGSISTLPWNVDWNEAEYSTILKVTSITDRNGNHTTYNYGSTYRSYRKAEGISNEKLLESVDMPGGRTITFSYTEFASDTGSVYLLTSAACNGKSVDYAYTDVNPSSLEYDWRLWKVWSPAERLTTYTWGQALGKTYNNTFSGSYGWFLTGIEDPRGLKTGFSYSINLEDENTVDWEEYRVCCYRVVSYGGNDPTANGIYTYFQNGMAPTNQVPSVDLSNVGTSKFWDYAGPYGSGGVRINYGATDISQSQTSVKKGDGITKLHHWVRTYEPSSLALVQETQYFQGTDETPRAGGGMSSSSNCMVSKTAAHNFMGNPVWEESFEGRILGTSSATKRTARTESAYWGADKYYQKKATRSNSKYETWNGSFWSTVNSMGWRYKYIDYYAKNQSGTDSLTGFSVSQEDWGGTKVTYDNKYGNPVPSDTGTGWRTSTFAVSTPAAKFDYGSGGRPITVLKLAGNGSSYVKTTTVYDGPFDEATKVIEDDDGANERETFSSTDPADWTWNGKPTRTTDAALREFVSTYDADGLLKTVVQANSSPANKAIQTNTYGETNGDISNGMPVTAIDWLGTVKQTFTYQDDEAYAPGGVCKVESVSYPMGGTAITNTLYYEYNIAGDRTTMKAESTLGSVKWRYDGYRTYGIPDAPQRRFTQMVRQTYNNGTWVDTAEHFWYGFDDMGRLWWSDFAPSYRAGASSYSTSYDTDESNPEHLAGKYVRAVYDYDTAGRTNFVDYRSHNWTEDWQNNWADAVSKGRRYEADYLHPLGLKSQTRTYKSVSNAWSEQTSDRQDYKYDVDGDSSYTDELDELSGAMYGNSDTWDTWTYDAAGNRSNSGYAYNSLNRMTASPGSLSYLNDKVGNRTWRNYGNTDTSKTVKYTWDELNRMKGLQQVADGASYRYRSDGLRIVKVGGITLGVTLNDQEQISGYYDMYNVNRPTTRYYYDGQMPVGEDYTRRDGIHTTDPILTDQTWYGVGARGMDYQSVRQHTTANGGSWSGYTDSWPVYDTHGNNVNTIQRSGNSPYFSLATNDRVYDAWGKVIATYSGTPQQGYSANVGHRLDVESGTFTNYVSNEDGLIYMRARYYEPQTGRFVSEDPKMHGLNWYSYCRNDPVNLSDSSGKEPETTALFITLLVSYYAVTSVFWNPNDTFGKTAKLLIDSTLATLACIEALGAITKLAAIAHPEFTTTALCFALLTIGLAGVLCGVAAYQLSLSVFIATNGDVDFISGAKLSDGLGTPCFRIFFGGGE